MPMYEYGCLEDGETITLLRPIGDADKLVDDPKGLGRRFTRQFSTFEVPTIAKRSAPSPLGGGCPCGNPNGPCRS
jgi:hypothetical protein